MQTIGWIGLGHMGTPMARNLVQAGFKVHVYNRTPEKTAPLVEQGAIRLSSPMEVAAQSDVIFLMLTDGAAVRDVLMQDQGVLKGLQPGRTVIDMSTIAPEESRAFAGSVRDRGGVYIDAPVSGSVGAAETAQLTILVGADEEATAACRPCFQALGRKIVYFGATGKGSAAKLAINLLLGVTVQGLGEAMVFAEQAGLERDKVIDMIASSGLNSGLFQAKKEMYRREEFPASFMLELMVKDLGLLETEAARLKLQLPLAETARTTFRAAKENGKARMDMTAVFLELKANNTSRS